MHIPLHILYNIREKYSRILIVISLILLSSCSLKIATDLAKTYPTLDYKEDVLVIALDEQEPTDTEFLSTVIIDGTGFTIRCDYDLVVDQVKLEARKIGGNAIKITKHLPLLPLLAVHAIKLRHEF